LNQTENIASVSLELKTMRIKHVTLYQRRLRFQCKRCATFCCKLGGPTLSLKDVERLKRAGCCESEFLDANHGCLKNKASGECVFLRFDEEKHAYECSVYNHRPALCKLYPFHFEKTSSNSLLLRIMPCMGINRRYGELFDEKLIVAHLLDSLRDLYF